MYAKLESIDRAHQYYCCSAGPFIAKSYKEFDIRAAACIADNVFITFTFMFYIWELRTDTTGFIFQLN